MRLVISIVLLLIVALGISAIESPLSSLYKVTSLSHLDRTCMMCKFSVSLISYALKTNRGYEQVDKIANNFCAVAHIESPLVCSRISKLFNHEVTKVLGYGLVTPDQVCGYLSNNTCGHYHNPLADWEVNLNVSNQLNHTEILKRARMAKGPKQTQRPYKIIQISDTHVDLNYREGSPAICEEPLCCQSNSTPSNNSDAKAQYWGTYGSCDIPFRTFESTLKFLNYTISQYKDIDYIIWTGDIQPHDVWAQSKMSATKIYDTVFEYIFRHLPNIKILPTFGNHEMVPVDSFSPSNLLNIARDDSPEWLYRKMDSFWSHWLPSETIATITKDGFYATTIHDGLKVVSLNTNFCHTKNFWLYINSTDPGNQLQWLIHELQISELLHEKVHIIGHIPPGADDCLKVWSKNFNKIVRRFSNTITGQFFGHTHTSEFEIFYDEEKKPTQQTDLNVTTVWKPISVGFIGPSLTTFIDLNPSFRIYNIDPSRGFMPTDFETYYVNLTEANLDNTKEPDWYSAGLMSQMFNIQDTSPSSLHNLLVDIAKELGVSRSAKTNGTSSEEVTQPTDARNSELDESESDDEKLFNLYRLYNSFSDMFDEADFDEISKQDKTEFLCKFFTGQAHDFDVCEQFLSMGDHYSDKTLLLDSKSSR